MTSYLLDCGCGNKVPVEIGQAGAHVSCSCGAQLDVPTLRKLRQLPTVAVEAKPAPVPWNKRKGIIAACLILAGALVLVNIWSRYTQPRAPIFNPVWYEQLIDQRLKNLTPVQAYNAMLNYRLMAEQGFPLLELSNRAEIEHEIAHRQFTRQVLWVLAGVFAAIAAIVASTPRR